MCAFGTASALYTAKPRKDFRGLVFSERSFSMRVLVIGGTRFFGVHTVRSLLEREHSVTIATRGRAPDSFGGEVSRITLDRTDPQSCFRALSGKSFDVIIDKVAYCSDDIKCVLDAADCGRYILMSTTAVYSPGSTNPAEEDFDPCEKELIWCGRMDFPYDEIKRQAECALRQAYPSVRAAAVRYPVVLGKDDYTARLFFYVDSVVRQIPMQINNTDGQRSFIASREAGDFMAFLAEKDFTGAVNGSAGGTVSVREILAYVEEKTGRRALLSEDGQPGPYNREPAHSVNTDKARALGYSFTHVRDWIYGLLDEYIDQASKAI